MKKLRPFLLIAIVFAAGIILQDIFHPSYGVLFLLCLTMLGMSCFLRSRRFVPTVAVILACLFLGGAYTYVYKKFPSDHIYYTMKKAWGRPVLLEGMIVSDITVKPVRGTMKRTFVLQAQRTKLYRHWRSAGGKIMVNVFQDRDFSYGDTLRVEAKLFRPYNFGQDRKFSYKKFLNHKGIYCMMSLGKKSVIDITKKGGGHPVMRTALAWRRRFKDIFRARLSAKEAGLMQAILVGDRSAIPPAVRDLFVRTGTAHVLAISGLHVGIVAAVFFLFWRLFPIPIKSQYFLTVLMLSMYVLMTGGRPSVIRAVIMTSLIFLGFVLERKSDSLNSLGLAALAIMLLNPMVIYDVGFQLSFLSVLSIMAYFLIVQRFSFRNDNDSRHLFRTYMIHAAGVSSAAWLGVAGLIAYYFEVFTPVAVLANILVVPLMTGIVALGLVLFFCGLWFPFLAGLVAGCVQLSLNLMVLIVYAIDRIPASSFRLQDVPLGAIILYYAILFSFLAALAVFSSHAGTRPGAKKPLSRRSGID